MLERFILTFLNTILYLAIGWIVFGAVYWVISEIQIKRLRALSRAIPRGFLKRDPFNRFVLETLYLRESIWEYVFYGPVMPIVHNERKKQIKEERENERLNNPNG